ncbi:hypothetical protein CN244_10910 [Sinorhizobium medicae]|nr:hypothetical protein CN244_10910 [Sinorhizobium medicae]
MLPSRPCSAACSARRPASIYATSGPDRPSSRHWRRGLLHVSFNRIRLEDKNMQQIKVLQRPLCV